MVSHDRYRSIKNVFKRDPDTHRIIRGEFSVPEFEYLQDCRWIFTEKMDGMNIRVILDDGVEFRGRSDVAQLPGCLVEHLRNTFDTEDIQEISKEYGEGLCLYGEGMGAGIQAGSRYGSSQFFTLFDVITDYGWASRRDVLDIATRLNIPLVPVVREGTLAQGVNLVSAGHMSTYGSFFAEGLVGRPELELRDRYGGKIICKIKHRDFYQGD